MNLFTAAHKKGALGGGAAAGEDKEIPTDSY